jgi:hypothetical protein
MRIAIPLACVFNGSRSSIYDTVVPIFHSHMQLCWPRELLLHWRAEGQPAHVIVRNVFSQGTALALTHAK